MKSFLLSILFTTLTIFNAMAQNMEDRFPISVINPSGNKKLIFYWSGDGGINKFTENICEQIGAKNYPVIMLNSRKYFWTKKNPDQIAKDASEIITHYLAQYHKTEFSLVGYSFGADAVLHLASRLPKTLQQKLVNVTVISPSLATDFTIKLADLLGIENSKGDYQTLPELNKLSMPVLCIFGEGEDKAFYNGIAVKKNIKKVLLPGSHKFNNDAAKVVNTIVTAL